MYVYYPSASNILGIEKLEVNSLFSTLLDDDFPVYTRFSEKCQLIYNNQTLYRFIFGIPFPHYENIVLPKGFTVVATDSNLLNIIFRDDTSNSAAIWKYNPLTFIY